MPKRIAFLIVLFVVSILIFGVIMFNQNFSVEGAGPRLHKKELSEYGVLVINSADPTYENDVKEWLKDKNSSFQQVATTLKPFSVFVRNTRDKDIIAYKLEWKLTNSEGEVATYPRIYFEPDCLMGMPKANNPDDPMSRIVRSNSSRFFTVVSSPFEGGGSGLGGISLGKNDNPESFRSMTSSGDISPLISKLDAQLKQTTDVTVSIEGALFEDGTYIGSNDEYFQNVKAYVSSKHDLLSSIRSETQKVDSSRHIFDGISIIANSDVSLPISGANFRDYYNYFRKMHAKEVMNMRRAIGDDSKTIATSISFLKNKWIIPLDLLRPENNK